MYFGPESSWIILFTWYTWLWCWFSSISRENILIAVILLSIVGIVFISPHAETFGTFAFWMSPRRLTWQDCDCPSACSPNQGPEKCRVKDTIYPDLNANIACKKRYNQNRLRLNEITTNGISRQIVDYKSEMWNMFVNLWRIPIVNISQPSLLEP